MYWEKVGVDTSVENAYTFNTYKPWRNWEIKTPVMVSFSMGKLLIVEDDQNYIKIYKEKFKGNEETRTTDNGLFGLKIAEYWQPDLMILDVKLKGEFTGIDVIKLMRKLENTKNIPVMMVTIADLLEEKARKLGVNEFFYKLGSGIDQIEATAFRYLS